MSLQSEAQLLVIDPSVLQMGVNPMEMAPLEVEETHSGHHAELKDEAPMEVSEPGEVSIVIDDLPGAPSGTHDPEPVLEVSEEDDKNKIDENNAKPKKDPRWDWEARGAKGFIAWVKERCDDVPKHSGYDTAGLERAAAYLEKLDNEISKAMRLDLDGELDANQIEKVRSLIDNGIERIHDRLDKVKKHKKTSRKKKSEVEMDGLVKEAQKITGVQGVFVTVDLLTSRIARVCINGMVSGGHDIEEMFKRQAEYYNLNKREKAQVIQLIEDMGYAMRHDRGYMPEDDMRVEDSGNFDWAANYKG